MGMTEVMSFPRKRESRIKRFWIPNQVGDDSGCDFEDDSYCGFLIKDFRNDKKGGRNDKKYIE